MSKIEPRLFDELKKVLVSFGDKYFIGNELNRSKVSDDLRAYDETLLAKLFEIDFIKKNYIKEVAGQNLFQIDQLEEAILYDNYWDTSYTKYENLVGLTSNGKFIEDNQDVVLDFPFKDGVLTASMTKEDNDNGYDDAFLNEVIEKDEIDRLFDKKILNHAKRYDIDGEKVTDYFDAEKDNLILKGNNLLALHTIRDKFAGKVKLIYIDVPYNTGKDSFSYNDKFSHSTWLTFIKNRLEIAWDLLSDDGTIWISIDDNESHYLKVLADEVFGRDNFLNEIVWQRAYAPINLKKTFSKSHDYIQVYAKNNSSDKELNKIPRDDTANARYKNPDNDPRGPWKSSDFSVGPAIDKNIYEITTPTGRKVLPPDGRSWVYSRERFKELRADNRVYFGKEGNSVPSTKKFLSEVKNGVVAQTLWTYQEVGHNQDAKKEIKALFDGKALFGTPKPEKLLQRILTIGSNEGDIVLDFFMGSATTQAVAMKMNRRFIGIEQMDYINNVSVPRLQKVIAGEQGGISKDVNWQGGGSFVYAELMQKNMGYLQDIISSKTIGELHEIYNRMLSGVEGSQEPADISFRADLDKIEWDATKVKFADQKRLLIKLLDKNGLYYNYSEIDDRNVREFLSDRDYQFNQSFYEAGE
ncbi:DNA methyltransferase [Lapidilactobacillus achengensis]|uniref:DNA methyltransferase n=1 Tax=Lapidilactobacillus achengensis TaxID=2486000 RepID=A0ABW1UTQ8_9LACO|nr:DNA methyltransferase [Lapidilactobacillus achengensis]